MPKKTHTAYSLLELSIVIVIISILISGAMTVSVGNINNAKIKITKDRIQVLHKALGNFVATNRRLPCPAAITLLKSDTNYGKETGTAGTCATTSQTYVSTISGSTNLVYGMVPAVTLGLAKDLAEDGWEDKIAYIIDKNFTAAASITTYPDFSTTITQTFSISTANNTSNNITVTQKSGSATITATSKGMFALISYGPNKKSAFGINSTTRNARSTDSDESANDIDDSNNFDRNLVSVSENSDIFDDIIFFTDALTFVASFNLYSLIPCNNGSDTTNYPNSPTNSKNAWFGQIVYGNVCTTSDYDKTYTKRCGPAGIWINQNNCSLP